MTEIEALIFDLDGVLANTIALHNQSWHYLADQFGQTFLASDLERWRGQRRRECLLDLFAHEQLEEAEIERRLEIKDRHYMYLLHHTAVDDLIPPSVFPLLENARHHGLKIGVASSSLNTYEVLRRLDLVHQMDAIADGNTVSRPKPYPDVFLWTAGALRTSPARVIVFEDSAAGVNAARTVDMFVVGIGPAARLQQANLVVPELGALTLDDFLRAARSYRSDQVAAAG